MRLSGQLAQRAQSQERQAPPLDQARLDHFRVAMLPIIAKFAARGRVDDVRRMFGVIHEPPPPSADPEAVLGNLHAILERSRDQEPTAAIRCIQRYLDTVPRLGYQVAPEPTRILRGPSER